MFLRLFNLLVLLITFGSVSVIDTYNVYSIDNIAYEDLTYRDIFEDVDFGYYELPNGVKTFEISGNDLVQRVKKYTLQASDIVGFNNTLLTNLDYITINKPTNSYGYNNRLTLWNYFEGMSGEFVSGTLDDVSNNNKIRNNFNDVLTLWYFTSGTYATLAEAQVDLVGTDIYYQLATPIVLHTFTTAPTQTQLDEMLEYYQTYVNHYDFDYTLKTLTITDLFLFTGHLIVWYVIIALIKKGVKKV